MSRTLREARSVEHDLARLGWSFAAAFLLLLVLSGAPLSSVGPHIGSYGPATKLGRSKL